MIISSLQCLVKTLSIYLSHSLLVTIWKRRSRTTILIFKGIGTKEAISTSIASARPAAIGRVGKVEKAKYNPESCSYKVECSRNRPIPKYYILCRGGLKAERSASEGRGA